MSYIEHLSKDKKLAKVIHGQEPLKLKAHKNIPLRLCASIMSQQLSTKVARVIFQRFLELYGGEEPTPAQIAATPFEKLRAIGLSNSKTQYGKFAHIMDPDGNKVELWQPNDTEFERMGGTTTK